MDQMWFLLCKIRMLESTGTFIRTGIQSSIAAECKTSNRGIFFQTGRSTKAKLARKTRKKTVSDLHRLLFGFHEVRESGITSMSFFITPRLVATAKKSGGLPARLI